METTRTETSAWWYRLGQFRALFMEYSAAAPECQLSDFIGMFRGASGNAAKKTILARFREKLPGKSEDPNLDHDLKRQMIFFPRWSTRLREVPEFAISFLFQALREKSGRISSSKTIRNALGYVGKDGFDLAAEMHGWSEPRYGCETGITLRCPIDHSVVNGRLGKSAICPNPDHVEFPFVIELAVFDRRQGTPNNTRLAGKQGREIDSCVNFAASLNDDLFSKLFDVRGYLAQARLLDDSEFTIVIHFVCPVIEWLNFGKSAFYEEEASEAMRKLFQKVLPLPRRSSEEVLSDKFAHEPLKAKGFLKTPLNEIALYISAKMSQQEQLMTKRGWCYVLENERLITKTDFDKAYRVINKCIQEGLLQWDDFIEEESKDWETPEEVLKISETPSKLTVIQAYKQKLAATRLSYRVPVSCLLLGGPALLSCRQH